jgi:hypothetical protein
MNLVREPFQSVKSIQIIEPIPPGIVPGTQSTTNERALKIPAGNRSWRWFRGKRTGPKTISCETISWEHVVCTSMWQYLLTGKPRTQNFHDWRQPALAHKATTLIPLEEGVGKRILTLSRIRKFQCNIKWEKFYFFCASLCFPFPAVCFEFWPMQGTTISLWVSSV